MVDCVLIVVAYRSARDLTNLLATVPLAVGELSWHAIIVNNDPTEDLGHVVSEQPQKIELIEAGENLGYAGGINAALDVAPSSRWTIFLNPDLTLEPGAITRMADAAGANNAVVPTILDSEGAAHYSLRREPTISRSLGDALLGSHWPRRPSFLSEIVRTCSSYARHSTVDWATGAALLVPTPAVRAVGPWDQERFFLYSEETDYCRRLREGGTQIHFLPEAVVRHRGGGSGTTDALHALLQVNRVRYFHKWHGSPASSAFLAVTVLHNLMRAHRRGSRAAFRALLLPSARASLPGGDR